GYLRPERAALYTAAIPDSVLVRAGLRPDPRGEVEWLVPFWGTRSAAGPKGCVHPMIVYAELLADSDPRNVETARRIHEQYLRSIVEAS
ncbi:MAG: type IV toxin-antitoxin system AbiEi family antitoxin, partial [Verrucomicrobia bacterium]|nr:type IV toxin-antitoxin system AbiEi family antitoxin [Verrucomicrobiota bacterium]